MSSFWGVKVKPGKPYTFTHSDSLGRLHLSQATLGEVVGKEEKGAGGKKCVLQCSIENRDPVYLCALVPEKSEMSHLELEFDQESVSFSVIGQRSIHLAGYYISEEYEDDMSDSLEGSDDDGLLESDDDAERTCGAADTMSSFWGVEVKPGKPYTFTHSDSLGRLHLSQATLGELVGKGEKGAGGKKCVLQCSIENRDPVYLCALVPEKSETSHLELEFDQESVSFSVIGQRSIHLAGYYIPEEYEDDMSDSLEGSDDDGLLESDDDGNMVMLDNMATDDGSDYDSESDDEDMVYNQRRGKSSVVIEEIQDDDKSTAGEIQNVSNKKHMDKSQLQLAIRTPPAESTESEDEDGFPVSLAESKKSSDSVSKNSKERSNEDRKRKSVAVSNRCDSSGELKPGNDGTSKKKKKAKDKGIDVGNENVNDEEKEVKQQDSPADPVNAKQKKKNKNIRSSEVVTDQQSAMENQIHKDDKEVTAQEASKEKSKKQKTQEADKSENQTQTGNIESGRKKKPLPTRTFDNGMIIEELEMGKPDGKRATRGKKVSVRYIGKLKNGKIFDSNVSGRPFEFRLGVGEVVKGWDVGVDGMRIGDKRRFTVPPSMGYGNQKVGPIPQNSTLYFDVELVNVR